MRCVVIGAGGAIGAAVAVALVNAGRPVLRLGRHTTPALELLDEASIADAAAYCGSNLTMVIDATGFLHDETFTPEKTWRQIDPDHMATSFAINAIGPALVMKHFLPRLDRNRRAVFATLSARVGSISDNRLGGWYSYRAAKAALNQLVRTAAIELARINQHAVCVGLHPGTVQSQLSRPFARTGLTVQTPETAATGLLAVIDTLTSAQSGTLIDVFGSTIPF